MTNLISTVSENQTEIIQSIRKLYLENKPFECDPTYSKGNFYKDIPQPKFKFDLYPEIDGVDKADVRNLPLKNGTVKSVMFDPPFVGGSRKDGKPGIIKERFGYYKNIPALWAMYKDALIEIHRVLIDNGILVFKCQDTVESGKNWFSHIEIMNMAIHSGFYPKDLFILVAKNRLISPNMRNQKHARKYHCYFWVFEKRQSRVTYPSLHGDKM